MSLIIDALKKVQKIKLEKQQKRETLGTGLPWVFSWQKRWIVSKRLILVSGLTVAITLFFLAYKFSIHRKPKPEPTMNVITNEEQPEDNVLFTILDEGKTPVLPEYGEYDKNPEELKDNISGETVHEASVSASSVKSSVPVSKGGAVAVDSHENKVPLQQFLNAISDLEDSKAFVQKDVVGRVDSPDEPGEVVAGTKLPDENAEPASSTGESGGQRVSIQSVTNQESINHFNLAVLYHKDNKYQEAIEEYMKTMELDPQNIQAYNNLGMVYYELGRLSEAEDLYKKAIEIDPGYDKAHHNLAVIYYLQDKLPQAILEFTLAIEYNPGNPESYNNLGLVYRKQGKLSRAKYVFQKGLMVAARYPPLHYNLAITLEGEGNEREAAYHYRKFLELSTHDQQGLLEKVKRRLAHISTL